MTKLDLVLARIRELPPERQEAMAVCIEILLDQEGQSLLSDEQWAEVEFALDNDEQEIPHEQVMRDARAKFA